MADYSLLQTVDEEGEFWLPADPTARIRGQLRFAPGDPPTLQLSGHFVTRAPQPEVPDKFPVILGSLLQGSPITLLKSFVTRRQLGAGSEGSCRILANRALVGAALPSPDAVRFERCRVGLTSLEEWIGESPIKSTAWSRGKGAMRASFRFPRWPDMPVVELGMVLRLTSTFTECQVQVNCLQWEHRCFLEIESGQPQLLDDLLESAFQCQNLLTLFIGQPVGLKEVKLTPADHSERERRASRDIGLLFAQGVTGPEEHPLLAEVFLPLAELGDELGTIARRWLVRNKELRIARNVFFGTEYARGLPLEFRFLSLMRVVETYHRSTAPGTYLPSAEYEKVREQIATSLPSEVKGDHRNALLTRIKYGNEFSLRKRLTVLLQGLPCQLRDMIIRDPKDFVARMVATRNYFVHFDSESEELAFSGIDLHWATERLRILLGVIFLIDTGVRPELIARAVQDCWKVKSVLER